MANMTAAVQKLLQSGFSTWGPDAVASEEHPRDVLKDKDNARWVQRAHRVSVRLEDGREVMVRAVGKDGCTW